MTNPFSLEGRTALVTGANRGLGRAFAGALADAGPVGAASMILHDIVAPRIDRLLLASRSS